MINRHSLGIFSWDVEFVGLPMSKRIKHRKFAHAENGQMHDRIDLTQFTGFAFPRVFVA